MNKSWLWIIGVIAILGIGTFVLISGTKQPTTSDTTRTSPSPTANNPTPDTTDSPATGNCSKVTGAETTIIYTADGFSPSCVKVAVGTKILWKNQTTTQLQVGVDPHPSHTGDRALTNGEFVLPVSGGSQTSVTLSKAGTYSYHNHLRASATGTIITE